MKCLYKVPFSGFFMAYAESAEEAKKMSPDDGGAIVPACVLNPKSLNLRQNMAYVEEVSE